MATPGNEEISGEDHTETCLAFPPGALAPPVARYRSGSVLSGKYRLDTILGEGGMGAVWRASNQLLDLPVAIKLIRADLDRDALRARLQLEARSVAKLGHPAIVRIYDVGETELGDPFIVMELLHGETLAQMLAHGRLSAVRAVQLLLPIIDACAAAHARGIVHRDLKPDNLLIALEDQRTQPKILDFGIAKLTDPRDANHRLTEVGTVVGSPDYMSPEQARGRDDVDYRTDIWSLCVVLYEAITGRTPFTAPNYNALLRAIVEDEPESLLGHVAGDAHLWEIIKKGLAKDRHERHRSMAELGRALAGWLTTHGVMDDVCGTSVDSKWLARSSDPLSLGDASPDEHEARRPDFDPKATHDSRPNAPSVDSRGPFTATIRPGARTRTRTLRAAAVACALLAAAALVLVFGPTRHARANAERSTTPAARAEATAEPVTFRAPTASAKISTVTAVLADSAAPPSPALAAENAAPAALASTKPAAPIAPRLSASASGFTPKHKAEPAAQRSSEPATRPRPRDLDLISPY